LFLRRWALLRCHKSVPIGTDLPADARLKGAAIMLKASNGAGFAAFFDGSP